MSDWYEGCSFALNPNWTFIEQCQSAATTPFCWPPNGVRVCVPERLVQFHWPPRYYDNSSRLRVTYDILSQPSQWDVYNSEMIKPGTVYKRFTNLTIFDSFATPIPGGPWNQRSLQMYMMRKLQPGDAETNLANVEITPGPTIILVRDPSPTTSKTSSSSRSIYRATATAGFTSSSYGESSKGDPRQGLSPAAIAGIVIGIILAFVLLIVVCYRQSRETSSAEQRRIYAALEADQQKRLDQQAAIELMQQRNVQWEVEGVQGAGVPPVERPPAYGDAPPKYTP